MINFPLYPPKKRHLQGFTNGDETSQGNNVSRLEGSIHSWFLYHGNLLYLPIKKLMDFFIVSWILKDFILSKTRALNAEGAQKWLLDREFCKLFIKQESSK